MATRCQFLRNQRQKNPYSATNRQGKLLFQGEGGNDILAVWIEDSGVLSRPCRKRRPSSRDRSPRPGAVPGAPPAQVRGGATGRPLVAGMARCGLKKGNSTQVRAADPSYCHRKRQGPLIEHLLCAHPMLNIDVRSLSPHNCPVR